MSFNHQSYCATSSTVQYLPCTFTPRVSTTHFYSQLFITSRLHCLAVSNRATTTARVMATPESTPKPLPTTTEPTTPQHQDNGNTSKNNAIFKLIDSTGLSMLDCVAGEYEDAFTLERFDKIAQTFANQGDKAFILARVQSVDPKSPEKVFYSYYNAFHLNKILFQTQRVYGKSFLHRILVLNPLTNSDIIGNVQYFKVVRKLGLDGSMREIGSLSNPHPSSTANNTARRSSPKSPGVGRISPSSKKSESRLQDWTWSSPKSAILPMDEVVKDTFTLKQLGEEQLRRSPSNTSPTSPIHSAHWDGNFKVEKFMNVTVLSKKAPKINPKYALQVSITPGTVTQFSVPVNKPEASSGVNSSPCMKENSKARLFSYQNALATSPINASIGEWQEAMIEGRETKMFDALLTSPSSPLRKSPKLCQITSSPTGGQSPTSPSEASSATSTTSPGGRSRAFALATPQDVNADIYEAILFANDSDYLESGEIRDVFRKNALFPEDAILFSMPEVARKEDQDQVLLGRMGLSNDEKPDKENVGSCMACLTSKLTHYAILIVVLVLLIALLVVLIVRGRPS